MANQTQAIDELRYRVRAKRKRLEAELEELKADATAKGREMQASLRTKLSALEEHMRGGWDNITEATATKINEWLKDD